MHAHPSPRAPSRRAKLVLVGGGARSGKSRTALDMALACDGKRLYAATAEALDAEMQERIERHRAERGTAFDTVELPRALHEQVERLRSYDVILLDCLTLYVSNCLLAAGDLDGMDCQELLEVEQRCLHEVKLAIAALQKLDTRIIVVTNEVGMGSVPLTRLGRVFRDLAGTANQWLASEAHEVWWCAFGIPVCLKPQSGRIAFSSSPDGQRCTVEEDTTDER